jgi:hypothetical protein
MAKRRKKNSSYQLLSISILPLLTLHAHLTQLKREVYLKAVLSTTLVLLTFILL